MSKSVTKYYTRQTELGDKNCSFENLLRKKIN